MNESSKIFQFTLTDLIDTLTIDQIKEVLGSKTTQLDCKKEILELAHDIDVLIQERSIKPSGHLIRLIVFLAQANLHIWFNKDDLKNKPQLYFDLLEFSQDMNGLRNHVRNLLIDILNENEAIHKKATFLSSKKWYSGILTDLNRKQNQNE